MYPFDISPTSYVGLEVSRGALDNALIFELTLVFFSASVLLCGTRSVGRDTRGCPFLQASLVFTFGISSTLWDSKCRRLHQTMSLFVGHTSVFSRHQICTIGLLVLGGTLVGALHPRL